PWHDADEVLAHAACHVRDNFVSTINCYAKPRIGQCLRDGPFNFQTSFFFFFRHRPSTGIQLVHQTLAAKPLTSTPSYHPRRLGEERSPRSSRAQPLELLGDQPPCDRKGNFAGSMIAAHCRPLACPAFVQTMAGGSEAGHLVAAARAAAHNSRRSAARLR